MFKSIIIIKLCFMISSILIFMIIYKHNFDKFYPNTYTWFDSFYLSVLNQTLTSFEINDYRIKKFGVIQNLLSFSSILIISLFVLYFFSKKN